MDAPCPTCGRTAGFRPAREFLAEVREHNAAHTRAELDAMRGEVERLEGLLGKLVNFIGRLPATLPTADEQAAFEAARDVCWQIEARHGGR